MMSWSHHESPSAIDSSTGTSSQNITHNSVGSSSSSNSNSSSVLNGVFGGLQFTDCDETSSLSNVSIRSNDGGKSSHKIQHLSVTTTITTQHQLATFSPIASPNLIPTIVQVQSQTQTLSNLKEQVSCIPSTSPRVHKMKQSTVALIERYIDCISDRNQGHVHDLGHLQLDELVNYMNGESSGILCSKSEHADETSSSNGSTTTTTTTTTSIKGSGVTIDKLINIRRMEYALMQSIYGLGHGSSCGVGNEVVTCSHEGWFASRQSYQGHHFKKEKSHEDAVMEHILSDFSSNDAAFMGKFGFTDSRREGGRSRDSSTVASMCEVVFTDTESEAASESDAFVACHCARGMCRKSGGFGACRSCTGSYSVGGMVASNDENVLDRFSETGSDIWEIV
ncbi:hypothetical protein BDR26DRAFT_859217 [Obelidium mucronatum]|nr:hypothetical protein BDR26DRAFT_859217 [Obelidium mucronatum]